MRLKERDRARADALAYDLATEKMKELILFVMVERASVEFFFVPPQCMIGSVWMTRVASVSVKQHGRGKRQIRTPIQM